MTNTHGRLKRLERVSPGAASLHLLVVAEQPHPYQHVRADAVVLEALDGLGGERPDLVGRTVEEIDRMPGVASIKVYAGISFNDI